MLVSSSEGEGSTFVLRLPADALRRPNPLDAWGKQHPILRVLVIIGRNAVGIPLLLVGIALSVPLVPGQGILTILLALLIMEFPGKWHLERQGRRHPQSAAISSREPPPVRAQR